MTLRSFHTSDLNALCKQADNANIAKYMMDGFPHPYTREAGQKFIDIATAPENIDRYRVIEVNGEFAGGIGIHPQNDIFRLNAEIAYWLAEEYWGKGYGTSAIKEMVEYAFHNLSVTRIYARIFGSNIGSAKAVQKAGFVLESTIPKSIIKHGKLEDCLVYGINRNKITSKIQ